MAFKSNHASIELTRLCHLTRSFSYKHTNAWKWVCFGTPLPCEVTCQGREWTPPPMSHLFTIDFSAILTTVSPSTTIAKSIQPTLLKTLVRNTLIHEQT